MRHENVGAVHTHTHTHTHTCISLKEEKRVDIIYVNFVKVLIVLISVQVLNIIKNLIGLIDRLLFSKQNDLLLKSDFLHSKKIKINNFLKRINIRNRIFEEVTISRLS